MGLTLQQKKTYDIVAPTLATAGVAYMLYRRGTKISWTTGGLLLLVFVTVYVLTTRITKNAYNASLDVDVKPDSAGCSTYNPAPLVLAIHTEQSSWSSYDSAPYEQLSSLGDCAFAKVCNEWNHAYPGKSLRAVLNAYSPWMSLSYNAALLPSLNDKFTRLNIS